MTLSKLEEHLLLDKRLRERFVRQGELDEKTIKKHVKDLPDVEGEAEYVSPYEEPGEETTLDTAEGKRAASEPTFEAVPVDETT